MKKIHIYFILILLSLLGCKKDYLDVEPMGVINSSSFYATKEDAEQAVTAAYGMLNYTQLWDYSIFSDLGSVASDDAQAGGNNSDDVADFQLVDKFTFTPSMNILQGPYGLLYKAIMFTNLAIERLPDVPAKDSSAGVSYINGLIGEVKFLRALNLFYLSQIYGEIPLADHVLGTSEFNIPRSSFKDVYAVIEKDLNDAVSVLPATRDNANKGRATKGSAQGLLAKVYLFESSYARNYPNDNYSLVNPGKSRFDGLQEKWGDALAMAEGVINSGLYDLPGINGEKYKTWRGDSTDGFRYIWTTAGDNSKESLFEIQCGYYGLGWLSTRGSAVVWWTGARWIFNPVDAGHAAQESGYWGFNVPSNDLLAEFNKEQRHAGDPLISSLAPADPRFNTTIHKDTIGGNDSISIFYNSDTSMWCKVCYKLNEKQFNPTGMYQAKYECFGDEYIKLGGGWGESPMNIRVLRYADVVLIAAEAAIMTGNNEKAIQYLNMVRKRARMCGPAGNTVPADYASGYTVTMDDLMHDRRLELAMEGNRFYDLVRWNKANEKLGNNSHTVILTSGPVKCSFQSPKNDFYPIPQSEVNKSQGKLLQYSGWNN